MYQIIYLLARLPPVWRRGLALDAAAVAVQPPQFPGRNSLEPFKYASVTVHRQLAHGIIKPFMKTGIVTAFRVNQNNGYSLLPGERSEAIQGPQRAFWIDSELKLLAMTTQDLRRVV